MIKMKSIGMKSKIALIAMAAVCLLMAPAFSMPSDGVAFKGMQDGKLCPMGNMTPEEMGNMTLGELQEMREQAWNNSTACPARNEGRNCNQMGNRMMAHDGQMGEDAGKNGAFSGRYFGESRHGPMGIGFSHLLQMDDLTADELNNMTLNQIKELQQKKMQELGNMTLNEINELRQKKMQALNNMTLNELMAKQGNMPGIGGFMGGAPFQGHRARG
jgi:CheY-specific phosphatase CheX